MDANDIVCYKRHCPTSVLSFVFDNVLLKALEPPGKDMMKYTFSHDLIMYNKSYSA